MNKILVIIFDSAVRVLMATSYSESTLHMRLTFFCSLYFFAVGLRDVQAGIHTTRTWYEFYEVYSTDISSCR